MMTKAKAAGKANASLTEMAAELESFVRTAASDGQRQYDVERATLERVIEMGRRATDLFLQLQGDGDLGSQAVGADGRTLYRSEQPSVRRLRTIFGEHQFTAYVYAAGSKEKIALRPIDAKIELAAGDFSYLFEEFAQHFCVDQAFGSAAEKMGAMFGSKVAVDSLERISRRLGGQAEAFLANLPIPAPQDEGAVLVATADGKGVPLVQRDAGRIPTFEQRERPGNRRMATLGGIYSVDRHIRTADDILAALFREKPPTPPAKRPEPVGKCYRGSFTRPLDNGAGTEVLLSGTCDAFRWLREQIDKRRRPGQPIVVLIDGQESLWDAAHLCFDGVPSDSAIIEILDIVHVAGYVWRAAKTLATTTEHREAFVWDRLGRILAGDVKGVIAGLRQTATKRGLKGPARKEIDTVCGYFENHARRMHYDEYLRAGYPIATGVIEGACRHLVKDRLERTGMRWTLAGAAAMLDIRAVIASSFWTEFNQHRMTAEQKRLHPNAQLLAKQQPLRC